MTTPAKTITLSTAPKLPTPVQKACQTLTKEGFKTWLAGGCVRDLIMNRVPRDWDIVTNAPIDAIRRLFPKHLEVGASFGVIKLPPIESNGASDRPTHIDIAIFRKEEGYSDLRHPDVVEPGDEHTDSARRDFTVNALYFDPEKNEIIDLTGGYKDIQSKLLRTVGDPSKRFSEDALRLLRAVRFAAQLNFKIDKPTGVAIKRHASLLKAISRERVREELYRLLESQRPVMGLEAVAACGLWEPVFGIKRVSLPADMRQLRMNWVPTPLHWLASMTVTGLLGDAQKDPDEIADRLVGMLRLTNQEKRTLHHIARVYSDSQKEPTGNAMEWVELARDDRILMDMTKSFIRRARGPSEEEKAKAIALIDQAQRWAAKPGSESSWPSAQTLMKKEGIKAGPKLGQELKSRQWQAFWATRP